MQFEPTSAQHILLRSFDRWLDLNEYEGRLDVQVGPWPLQARALLNPREWNALHAGQSLAGEVYLQAYGDAEPATRPAGWVQEDGVNYALTGTVEDIDGDDLTLALPGGIIRVDLDGHALKAGPGNLVTVRGELDFEAED